MSFSKAVPLRIAVLGVILGLVLGGAAAATFSQSSGLRTSTTTTETQTVTTTSASRTVSTVTSTIEVGIVTSTVTSTASITRDGTMDLQATQLLYYGGSPITLFGTIFPPPSSAQGIVIVTRSPSNLVVDVGQAQVSGTTGSFSYVIGASGTQSWIQGAYSVSATSGNKTVSTVFYFTPSQSSPSTRSLLLTVLAPPLVSPGEQVDIAVVATLPNGAPDNVTIWSTLAVLFPDGVFRNLCGPANPAAGCAGTFARIQVGFYQVVFTLPNTAQQGTYFVEAAVSDSAGSSGRALGEFSVP